MFGIKTYAPLTRRAMKLDEMLPWAGADLKTGISSLIVVFITGVVLWIFLRKRDPSACSPDEPEAETEPESEAKAE